MVKHYFKFLSKKGKYILIINLLLVFIFASLYYIQDYIIFYYPHFSEKYLLESEKNNHTISASKIKPFIYYLWFSLITQSTVGYTGLITKYNKEGSFNNIRSIPFKFFNILQMISIFITAALLL